MSTHDIDQLIDKIEASAPMDIAGRSKYIHDLRSAIQADRQRIADQFHKDGFYDGVILGLQAMAACGNAFNADYVELLRSAGVHETVKRAMKEGLYELAGLDSNASEDLRKEIDSTRKEFTQKIIYGSAQNEHT